MVARILVIDDAQDLLHSIAICIRRLGHKVDTADNADSGMALLKKNDYDIVVTDKNMPSAHYPHEESGVEIVRYISLHLPATAVIMITGYATIESAKTVMRLGASDYLLKPFDEEELKTKITRALEFLTFVNPHDIIGFQGRLRNSILDLITPEAEASMEKSKLNDLLATVNANIDLLFMAQKRREKIILAQREALAQIAGWAAQLKDAHPRADASSDLLDTILQVAEHRV